MSFCISKINACIFLGGGICQWGIRCRINNSMTFIWLMSLQTSQSRDLASSEIKTRSEMSECYSQVGKRWQVFESSLWYQGYVITMERSEKVNEMRWKRRKNTEMWALTVWMEPAWLKSGCTTFVGVNHWDSQQTKRPQSVEGPLWYAPQAVVAQDSLHTECNMLAYNQMQFFFFSEYLQIYLFSLIQIWFWIIFLNIFLSWRKLVRQFNICSAAITHIHTLQKQISLIFLNIVKLS